MHSSVRVALAVASPTPPLYKALITLSKDLKVLSFKS